MEIFQFLNIILNECLAHGNRMVDTTSHSNHLRSDRRLQWEILVMLVAKSQTAEPVSPPNVQVMLIVKRCRVTDSRENMCNPAYGTEFVAAEKCRRDLGWLANMVDGRAETQNAEPPNEYVAVL